MPWIRVISCLGDFLAMESSTETNHFHKNMEILINQED